MHPFFKISGITALIAFPAISLAAQLEGTAVHRLTLAAWKAHVAESTQGLASPIEIKTTLSN